MIKDYLKEKKISIKEISDALNISYSTLQKNFNSPEKMRVTTLKEIANYLNISLDFTYDLFFPEKIGTLLKTLRQQKKMKLKGNLYHNTQIKFCFNSNRIEGSRLSEDETRYIFETNTLLSENKSSKVDDIIETVNHFQLFDEMLEIADIPLSEQMIKNFHSSLKQGTNDSKVDWFNVGEYKSIPNEVGGNPTTPPKEVSKEMKKLLNWYHLLETVSFKDIIEFHYRFEKIHPFQDGNGRIGRIIIFKECLKNNITPFIIKDSYKAFYYRGLENFETERGFLIDTCLAMQDKYQKYMEKFMVS